MEPIQAANGLSFRVGLSGHSGHLRLEPLSTVERTNPVNTVPDFILVGAQLPLLLGIYSLSLFTVHAEPLGCDSGFGYSGEFSLLQSFLILRGKLY